MSRRNVLERINIPGPVNSTPEALEAWARSMTSLLTDTFQQFGYAINNLDILLEDGDLIDDRVATLIQDGTGLSWTYDDPNDMLTGNVSLAPFNTGNLSEGSNLYYTDERVDDRVSSLIQDGTGLSWTYDDGANTLTGDVSLSSFDTDDLSEGASNLYYTDARVDARLDTNQTISEIWTFQNRISIHQSDGTAKDYLWARDSTDKVDLVLHYNGLAYELRTESNGAGNSVMRFNANGSVNLGSGSTVNGNAIWHAGNDGPTSGLDADTVDGYEGSELAVLAENNIFTRSQRIESSTENQSRLTLRNTSASGNDWIIASLDNGGWYLTAAGTGGAELQMGSDGGLFGRGASGSSQGLGTANFQQSYNNGNATLDSTDLAANGGTVPQNNVAESISQTWKFTKSGTGTNLGALFSTTNPGFSFQETVAAADNGLWDFLVASETLKFRANNDALTVSEDWLTVDRTGTTIDAVNFPNGTLKTRGNATLDTSDLAENSPGGGIAQTNVSETILEPWNFTGGLFANGNSVLDESDRIENGGNLPKIISGSLTTISLGIGSSVEETVNHGLGTDNVFAIVRLLGSDGSDGHEVHGVSITPDGLRSHLHAGGAPSTIGLGLGSTPSSGNINLLIRNGSGTTSQTVTVDYTIIAA